MSKSKIEKILILIKKLPEDTNPDDMDEIIYSLYAKKQILQGLEDIRNGNVSSHEDVKKSLTEKWLKKNSQ